MLNKFAEGNPNVKFFEENDLDKFVGKEDDIEKEQNLRSGNNIR
jgi:hypothetical protein